MAARSAGGRFMKKKELFKKLLQLFASCFYISAFTFGGGFVIVTFMKKKFVDRLHWIDNEEMLDITALSQSAPGSITVNASILLGWRIAGLPGMLAAVLGAVLPPILILSVISLFYTAFASDRIVALALRGMRAGVAAVILDVVWSLGSDVVKERSILHIAVMAAAFAAVCFFRVNVMLVILAAGLIGAVRALWLKGQQRKEERQ